MQGTCSAGVSEARLRTSSCTCSGVEAALLSCREVVLTYLLATTSFRLEHVSNSNSAGFKGGKWKKRSSACFRQLLLFAQGLCRVLLPCFSHPSAGSSGVLETSPLIPSFGVMVHLHWDHVARRWDVKKPSLLNFYISAIAAQVCEYWRYTSKFLFSPCSVGRMSKWKLCNVSSGV